VYKIISIKYSPCVNNTIYVSSYFHKWQINNTYQKLASSLQFPPFFNYNQIFFPCFFYILKFVLKIFLNTLKEISWKLTWNVSRHNKMIFFFKIHGQTIVMFPSLWVGWNSFLFSQQKTLMAHDVNNIFSVLSLFHTW
jgi:hypothetical protein